MAGATANDTTDALARLETELALLTRTLEGMSRRSTIYDRLDRAGYLLARTIAAEGPSSIGGLAALVGLDATTVTRQVAALEADGLVERTRRPGDARVSIIGLTARGRRHMAQVQAERERRIADLLADWPEDDRRAFGDLLGRFNDAIRAGSPVSNG